MSKKKKHHYVPRFYLKRFSIEEQGKFLGLFNHESEVFVQKAALKHQAYGNFLYGEDDEIENALACMEGTMAKLFHCWIDKKLFYPPPAHTNGFKLLQRFILYQIFRTPKAGDNMLDQMTISLKAMLKEHKPHLYDHIKSGRLEHENSVLLTFLYSIGREHLLNFLGCKFLVNLTSLPFIMSDSPIVLYNQLMEKAQNYIGATALTSKGLQIFFPIHPRLMLCLYDENVYEFGNGCKNCFGVESKNDVDQLNGLQLINCRSQVFFNEIVSKDYIMNLVSNYSRFRTTKKSINQLFKKGSRKFQFISSEDPKINLNVDFFDLKANPANFSHDLVSPRHPSMNGQ